MSNCGVVELFIKRVGISLDSLHIDESGLRREDALEAINMAREARVPVLGGDVYILQRGYITSAYSNWHVERLSSVDHDNYLNRSWESALQYIKAFPEPSNGTPLFVVVLGSPFSKVD